VTKDVDGTLVPPPGENIISCPHCHHPRYYVLVGNEGTPMDGRVARIACAHCGEEVSWNRDDYTDPEV
jgi:hypothetical protein